MKTPRILLLLAVLASLALTQSHAFAGAPDSSSNAFDRMKSLAGEWEGKVNEGGQEMPAITSFRVVSDNSAILNVLGGGTPHEMVTMFHMDGKDLLATHYCAVHNQPRFRFVSSSDPMS